MITSVKIKDNTKTPFEYVSDIEAFENGKKFIFKPGVNVIIGKNGSGKSTLLNIISMYALCEKSMCSEMPTEALDFPPIFDDDDKVFDGKDNCYEDFMAGAEWSISSAWHDASETPQHSGMLIAIKQDGTPIVCGPNNSNWKIAVRIFHIVRWAYIENLLPITC